MLHHQGQQHVAEPLRSAEAAELALDVLTGEAVDRGRCCCAPAALYNSSCFNVPCCSRSSQHSQLTAHCHALPSCCSARDDRLRPAPGRLTPAQRRSPDATGTHGQVSVIVYSTATGLKAVVFKGAGLAAATCLPGTLHCLSAGQPPLLSSCRAGRPACCSAWAQRQEGSGTMQLIPSWCCSSMIALVR